MAKAKFGSLLLLCQGIMVILFVVFVDYGSEFTREEETKNEFARKASVFQDLHVSVFLGFGLIMTFLRRYSRGMLVHVFLIGTLVVQWATLLQGFFTMKHTKVEMSLKRMISADFAVITVLISFGAIMGKCNSLQLLVISLIEVFVYAVNEFINLHLLKISDLGRSIVVHVFGAYFGLAVSRMIYSRKVCMSHALSMSYKSEMYTFIGTLFLWTYWPSVNSLYVDGAAHNRAIANTFYALAASCASAFSFSVLQSKESKFNIFHLQNATLSGGIAIGSVAAMFLQPWGAVIVGIVGSITSVLSYKYLVPKLRKSLKIHDTRGVHAAHGIPGILSAIVSVIVAVLASESSYGISLYKIYPARAPAFNTTQYIALQKIEAVPPGENRKGYVQGLYQLAGLAITIILGILGGVITGLIIRLSFFEPVSVNDAFDDHVDFEEANPIDVLSFDAEFDDMDDEPHHDVIHGKQRRLPDDFSQPSIGNPQSIRTTPMDSRQSLLLNHVDNGSQVNPQDIPEILISIDKEPDASANPKDYIELAPKYEEVVKGGNNMENGKQ